MPSDLIVNEPKCGQKKRYISWDEIQKAIKKLADMLPSDKPYIYGIPRNGTLLAILLDHASDNLAVLFDGDPNFNTLTTILVDDIHDTGRTIDGWGDEFTSATLYWRKKDGSKPNYFVETIDNDDWLVFPWEKQ